MGLLKRFKNWRLERRGFRLGQEFKRGYGWATTQHVFDDWSPARIEEHVRGNTLRGYGGALPDAFDRGALVAARDIEARIANEVGYYTGKEARDAGHHHG